MRIKHLGIMALAMLAMPAAASAAAENQPWCAIYPTDMGRTANCAFLTREQCLAGVSGIGTCEPNRSYKSHRKPPGRDRRHRRD